MGFIVPGSRGIRSSGGESGKRDMAAAGCQDVTPGLPSRRSAPARGEASWRHGLLRFFPGYSSVAAGLLHMCGFARFQGFGIGRPRPGMPVDACDRRRRCGLPPGRAGGGVKPPGQYVPPIGASIEARSGGGLCGQSPDTSWRGKHRVEKGREAVRDGRERRKRENGESRRQWIAASVPWARRRDGSGPL